VLKSLSQTAKFRIYLSILSAVGVIFILLTTSKYGAGVSSDAARNLSTADNLLAGKGFVDMTGGPFILWPPLYPLVMAGVSLLTNWSTFQSAWYLNVALYAVNIWLAGWFLFKIFTDNQAYAVFGALIILLSRSMLRIHANVASEPLFATFALAFFFSAADYLKRSSLPALWLMFVMAGLATLQRYLGVVLFGVASAAVLYKEGRSGIFRATLPFIVSILPSAAWAWLHNYQVSGTLFGPRDLGAMLPFENISLSLTKIIWWFIPRISLLDELLLRPWMILLGLILLLAGINKKQDWVNWLRALANDYVWPALLFSVVYFFLLAFTVVTADHLDLTSDRYYIVILPPVLALLFIIMDKLVVSHLKFNHHILVYASIALAVLWLGYPVYSMYGYIRQALVQGEPTNYNIANSANFREMRVVKAAQPFLDQNTEALVYSNYVNIVWFIYHHPVESLPYEDAGLPRAQRLSMLKINYPDWPSRSGYIIWFTPNQYHHIVAPDELATIANLKLLYQDKTGQIYFVEAGN
jgi:hypothetical protein